MDAVLDRLAARHGERLIQLDEAGATEAITILRARDPAGHFSADSLDGVADLLERLGRARDERVAAMLAQDPLGPADITDPHAVAGRLQGLLRVSASAVTALLARDPASHARLDDPAAVAYLIRVLREAKADGAAAALASRAARNAGLDNPEGVAELLGVLCQGRAGDAVGALLARDPAGRADLRYQRDPFLRDGSAGLADLLRALNDAGAHGAVAALAIRCYDAGMFHLSYLDFAPQYPFGREPGGTPSHPWQWHDPSG